MTLAKIVFASMTGNTEEIADIVADKFRDLGVEVEVDECTTVDAEDFLEADIAVVATYTYGDGELPDESDNALAYLAKERERLQALIEHIKEEICITKECFPYNRRDIVKDSAKIEEMKQEFKRLQKLYEEEIELYKAKIAEMLE